MARMARIVDVSYRRFEKDRTPRVSSGPEWAARESTHPARGTPCATGLACQRGTRASGGRVVRATPRRFESLPPGALGGVLMVGKPLIARRAVCYPLNLTRLPTRMDSILSAGCSVPDHLQNIFGRGVTPVTLAASMEKGKR